MHIRQAAFFFMLMLSGTALAQSDIVVTKSGIGSGGGIYLGAAVGNTNYDEAGGDDVSVSIFGGYNLNDILGVEVGWSDYGSSEINNSTDEAEASALLFSVVGNVPLSNEITAFAQLGVARWDYSMGSVDENDTDMFFGLGIDYWVSGRANVRFAYVYLPLDGQAGAVDLDETLQTVQVGFVFHP